MNLVHTEIYQRIRKLTASGRRDRRKAIELARMKETIDLITDALLLARSRLDLLVKHLDHAERKADATRIAGLAPEIRKAVAERNLLQKNFLTLTTRLRKRFGIEVPVQNQTPAAEVHENG